MDNSTSRSLTILGSSAISAAQKEFEYQLSLLSMIPSYQQPADPLSFVARNSITKDEETGHLVIRARDNPIQVLGADTYDIGTPGFVIAGINLAQPSNKIGLHKEPKCGKYNDEGKLMCTDYGTVELLEVYAYGEL